MIHLCKSIAIFPSIYDTYSSFISNTGHRYNSVGLKIAQTLSLFDKLIMNIT